MKKLLKNEKGGLSDFVGFILLIVAFVMIPFLFSYQIFQYYYTQSIIYNSASLALRAAEVGYSQPNFMNGDYNSNAKSKIEEVFKNNMKLQGIDPENGAYDYTFTVSTNQNTPFIKIFIDGKFKLAIAGGFIQRANLPLDVSLTGRKNIGIY